MSWAARNVMNQWRTEWEQQQEINKPKSQLVLGIVVMKILPPSPLCPLFLKQAEECNENPAGWGKEGIWATDLLLAWSSQKRETTSWTQRRALSPSHLLPLAAGIERRMPYGNWMFPLAAVAACLAGRQTNEALSKWYSFKITPDTGLVSFLLHLLEVTKSNILCKYLWSLSILLVFV